MLKYQACLAFQHWDIRTFLGGECFVLSSILRMVEQGTLYEMDRKCKANRKLTIGWRRIFYKLFSFSWKLFWKRFEDNNTVTETLDYYHQKVNVRVASNVAERLKGTVMQIGKALINDRLRVSKVSRKFRIPAI